MSPTMLPTPRRQPGITGTHVLCGMVGFFGVVFAVNAVMLTKALSTHSGIVAVEPYRKGLDYNRRIEADARQARLGWQAEVSLAGDGRITLDVRAADGRPVAGLAVAVQVGRPSTGRDDRRAMLAATDDGRYAGDVGSLDAGAWLVSVEAALPGEAAGGRPATQAAAEPQLRMKRRLWLKP